MKSIMFTIISRIRKVGDADWRASQDYPIKVIVNHEPSPLIETEAATSAN